MASLSGRLAEAFAALRLLIPAFFVLAVCWCSTGLRRANGCASFSQDRKYHRVTVYPRFEDAQVDSVDSMSIPPMALTNILQRTQSVRLSGMRGRFMDVCVSVSGSLGQRPEGPVLTFPSMPGAMLWSPWFPSAAPVTMWTLNRYLFAWHAHL